MTTPTPPFAASPKPAGKGKPGPLAVGILALILAAVIAITVLTVKALAVAFKLAETPAHLAEMPAKIAASLASAFQPQISVQTLFASTIGELHSHPKLVVLTTQIDAEVDKASNTTWVGINFGTTTVHVRAHGNRVQYYIPLQTLSTSNFVYDNLHKKLIVRVPAPRLDEEVVDVQSDPSQIDIETHNGWAKLDSFSGAALRDAARSELRRAVLQAGRHTLLEHEAESRGRDVLKNTLRPITDALRPDVELDIEFVPRQ